MKSFILILSFFILFLSIKSGIDVIFTHHDNVEECCADVCNPLKSDNESQNTSDGNKCNGKLCNPFQICCSGGIVFIDELHDYLPKPHVFENRKAIFQPSYISQFATDFWQPPKNV